MNPRNIIRDKSKVSDNTQSHEKKINEGCVDVIDINPDAMVKLISMALAAVRTINALNAIDTGPSFGRDKAG